MVIKDLKTPYYLFDESECINRTHEIKNTIASWGGKICYAIKANPFLIPSLLHTVDKFEVCSPGELEICRKYHVPGAQILFSGVVKTKENIGKALSYPVDVITLESITQWELLKECLYNTNINSQPIKIMPRLSNGAQFGMEEVQLLQIIEEQSSMENVVIEGIHYFTGTQKKGNAYEKELDKAAVLLDKLKNVCKLDNLILEYGPGFSVPYFNNDDFLNPFGLVTQLKNYIEQCKYPFRIDIELGRYIAASCGKYITSIVDIKTADERNYCLVDGGINHVNYYGSNMAMRTPIVQHIKNSATYCDVSPNSLPVKSYNSNQMSQKYMICGSLCTFADILVRDLALNAPQIGDRLVFENIGAYSVTESNYLFLSRDLPGIYLKNAEGTIIELRPVIPSFEINS